jgi:ATP-dependent RNA helicase DeaD
MPLLGYSRSHMSDTPEAATDPAPEQPTDYVADVSFDDLKISEPLRRAIAERGYLHPTPVQAKAFQPVLEGRDLIVRSKTGTGKTAAFGIPLLERLPDGEKQVKVLVLCPTRELALQVATEISSLAKYRKLSVAAIYGGAPMRAQETALEEGAAIVVGTPGRVYDHIRRKNLKLEACAHAVLDEADEMLNQGFYEEVTRILNCLPDDRQVLLFSATVPPDIQNLITRYTTDAETLLLSGDVFTVEHIHHVRYDVSDEYPKPRNLIYVLEMEEPENAIIFCNTRDDTELVTAVLNRNGFDAELLNGDLPQKERERVMAKVKRGEVAFMVATDIAARGIDISDLGHVLNYSLPEDPAVYLHRVGRTGRIGKKGTAINLVSGRELTTFSTLEKKYGITFEKRQMPTPEEALALWTEHHVREIRDGAAGAVYEGYFALAGQLKGRPDADDLIAFLLKYFFTHHRMERAQGTVERRDPPASRPSTERAARERGGREREPREGRERAKGRERTRERPPPARERKPEEAALPSGQARVWINVGKMDGASAEALRAGLEEQGAPAGKLVRVELRGTYSYLVVADPDVAAFEALNGKALQGKSLKIERAKRR